jgi:hypothetical protein
VAHTVRPSQLCRRRPIFTLILYCVRIPTAVSAKGVGLHKDRDVNAMAISKRRGVCQPSVRAYTDVNLVAWRFGCVRPCFIVITDDLARVILAATWRFG